MPSVGRVSHRDFGLLIAYLIPGFIVVGGLSSEAPLIQKWLGVAPADAPTVGGFLYTTIASVAAGLAVSTVRWLVLDQLHSWTGLRQPKWDFARWQVNLDAFDTAVEYHYRYYQFYGNTLVATLILSAFRLSQAGLSALRFRPAVCVIAILVALFFIASRDTLSKYYARTRAILDVPPNPQETSYDCQTTPPTHERLPSPEVRRLDPKGKENWQDRPPVAKGQRQKPFKGTPPRIVVPKRSGN